MILKTYKKYIEIKIFNLETLLILKHFKTERKKKNISKFRFISAFEIKGSPLIFSEWLIQ